MEKEIKKISVITPDVPLKKKKYNWKIRGTVYFLVMALLVFLAGKSLEAVNNFFSINELKFNKIIEIKFNKPIEILNRKKVAEQIEFEKKTDEYAKQAVEQFLETKVEPAKEAGASAIPVSRTGGVKEVLAANSSVDVYADFIYWRESHKDDPKMAGLHRTCLAKGKWNGIGYLPSPGYCFDSKEEGMATLHDELTARLEINNEVEVLCVYNLGPQRDSEGKRVPYQNCKYYQDYLNFIK